MTYLRQKIIFESVKKCEEYHKNANWNQNHTRFQKDNVDIKNVAGWKRHPPINLLRRKGTLKERELHIGSVSRIYFF